MFRIKICGITNVNDALGAARSGADAIGLNFFSKSRRFVGPGVAREIASALPADVVKVGVFVNLDASEIADVVERVQLDCIQLHGDETPGTIADLPSTVRVVRAYRCGAQGLTQLAKYLNECESLGRAPDAVLIDADAGGDFGGTGRAADWSRIAEERKLLDGIPLILAGGLNAENVASAIKAVRPDGVDVASGVEKQPAIKDPVLVARFITSAKQAFASCSADHDS